MKFIQCGNKKQCSANGMPADIYSFAKYTNKKNTHLGDRYVWEIKRSPRTLYSIEKEYATTFRLEIIKEDTFKADDIPF